MSNLPGVQQVLGGATTQGQSAFANIKDAQGLWGPTQQAAFLKSRLFANLLPFAWRGLGFPYANTKLELAQDLVEHRFADLDGADVEATGRAPLRIRARIPFLNNIAAAPSELWTPGDLYPNTWRKMLAAFQDRSSDILQHPELGPITCRPGRFDTDWDSKTRDGVWVDAEWIETFDSTGALSASVTGAGLISIATAAGIDLDTLLPTIPQSAYPGLPKNNPSFADFARQLQGVADQISLLQYSAAGAVDAIVFRVQNIESAFTNAFNPGPGSVQYWPTLMAADSYLCAVANVKQTLLQASAKSVGLYIPASDTTLAMIAQSIPAPVSDLMNLNPSLLSKLVVPSGTKVRYYLSSTAKK